jgi:chaperonin GroES
MIRPVLDNVLIKVDVVEEKSAGGLLISSLEKVVKNTGAVVAVGDSPVIRVSPGDHVLFEKGMGRRFEVPAIRTGTGGVKWTEQEPFILIGYYDILAIWED